MSLKRILRSTVYNQRLRFNDDWRLRYVIGATPDITPPVLSLASATETGATTASGTVVTDTGEGTLYTYISLSETPPVNASDPTGAALHLSQGVTAIGSQAVSITPLEAETTYYAHYQHLDNANNPSNIVTSGSFLTDDVPALDAPVFAGTIPTQNWEVGVEITPLDLSGYFTGEEIVFSFLNGLPAGISFNASTATLTGVPSEEVTDATNGIRATNSSGFADSNNFAINVEAVILAPVFNGSISNLTLAFDQDMSVVSFASEFTGGGAPTSYSISDLPSGLAFNTVTCALSGKPNNLSDGVTGIFIRATNSAGFDDSTTFNITIALDAPVFAGTIPNQDWTVGIPITPIDLDDYFSGGVVETWTPSVAFPTGVYINAFDVIVGTPTDADDITGIVINGANATGNDDSNAFNISISAAVTSPVEYGVTAGYNADTTGDYFVSLDGDDLFNGLTYANAFRNIQTAVDEASPGDVITVGPGIFREKVDMTGVVGVRIKRYGSGEPIVSAAEILGDWDPCDSGDEALVGPNYIYMYKTTLPAGSTDALIGPSELNLYENGEYIALAHDRAVEGDPFNTKNADDTYHTPDSFVLSGANASGIVDSSVFSAYTSTQLVNAFVQFWAEPNVVVTQGITAYNGSDTITLDGAVNEPENAGSRYSLYNILPNIKEGEWGYKETLEGDGSRTIYIWPNNAANLTANIEYSARTSCINTSTSEGCMLDGIIAYGASGTGNRRGICIGNETNAVTPTHRDGLTLYQVKAGRNWGKEATYGAIYISSTDNIIVDHCTVVDSGQSFGIFVQHCNDAFVKNMHVNHSSNSPYRFFGKDVGSGVMTGLVVQNILATDCGGDAHSNLINFYNGIDTVLLWGAKFVRCRGYLTWQQASNIYIGFVQMDALPPSWRSIVDQNDKTTNKAPDLNGKIVIFNCESIPDPDQLIVAAQNFHLGNDTLTTIKTYLYNCIYNGGGMLYPTVDEGEEKSNVLYGLSQSQDALDLDPTCYYASDIGEVYVDAPNGDFTYTPAGAIFDMSGQDLTTLMSEIAGLFPTADLSKNLYGGSINWASNIIGPGVLEDVVIPEDTVDPVFASSVPAVDATGVAIDGTMSITFTEANVLSLGANKVLTIYDVTNGAVFETFNTTDDIGTSAGQITLTGKTIAIYPTTDLDYETQYSYRWEAGLVKDGAGNNVAVRSDNAYSFTTAAEVLGYIPPNLSIPNTLSYNPTPAADAPYVFYIFNIVRTSTAQEYIFSSGGANNTYVRFNVGTNASLVARFEYTTGTPLSAMVSGTTYAVGDSLSCIIMAGPTGSVMYINGAEEAVATYADAGLNFKQPQLVNSLTVGGTEGGNMNIRGWIFIGNTNIVPSTAYSSFFDGSNVPKDVSITTGGVTAQIFMKGNAAYWNGLGSKLGSGTVTEIT